MPDFGQSATYVAYGAASGQFAGKFVATEYLDADDNWGFEQFERRVGDIATYVVLGSLPNVDPDQLHGGDGNDVIRGGLGADVLSGGVGNDAIYGEQGQDLLDGGQGDDTLIGGQGADFFVFRPGNGQDVIEDFEVGIDRIAFYDLGLDTVQDLLLLAQEVGQDVVFDLTDGDVLTLQGAQLTEIEQDTLLL